MALLKLLLAVSLLSSSAWAVELCGAIRPGATCVSSCPSAPGVQPLTGFPYCYSNTPICCEPQPTTTSTTTTAAQTVSTSTTTTTAMPPHRQCGFNAIAVSARLMLNTPLPITLNPMDCAWPWVTSIYLTTTLPEGRRTTQICNAVLLNKGQILTIKECVETFQNIPNFEFKLGVSVGRCNVTGIEEMDLQEIDLIGDPIGSDLLLLKFKDPVTEDYHLNFLPACIPDTDTEFRTDNQSCIIASRSLDQGFVTSSPVRILDNFICNEISQLMSMQPQREGTFCIPTFESSFNLCDDVRSNGDEGGVVMCPDQHNNWVLKGIIKRGNCRDEPTNEIIDIENLGQQIIDKMI